MKIAFSPIRHDEPLSLACKGDVLTINGQAFDFSPIPEGAVLPQAATGSDWITSGVTRKDGHILLSVMLPHGELADGYVFSPAPITAEDGEISLPEPKVK